MSNSKFGMPMPIQQPPPVCKKGPENLPISSAWPPTDLEAAVTYTSFEGASNEQNYQAIVHLVFDAALSNWLGSDSSGSFTAVVEFEFNPATKIWWAMVLVKQSGSGSSIADFDPKIYKGPKSFATLLQTAIAQPSLATVTLKIMA